MLCILPSSGRLCGTVLGNHGKQAKPRRLLGYLPVCRPKGSRRLKSQAYRTAWSYRWVNDQVDLVVRGVHVLHLAQFCRKSTVPPSASSAISYHPSPRRTASPKSADGQPVEQDLEATPTATRCRCDKGAGTETVVEVPQDWQIKCSNAMLSTGYPLIYNANNDEQKMRVLLTESSQRGKTRPNPEFMMRHTTALNCLSGSRRRFVGSSSPAACT